jgi:hypothetical protein
MAWDMEMPDEMGGGGNFLTEPGAYHCAVTQVLEGTGPKGGIIDGFTVGLDMLAGTVSGQEHKVFNLTLFNARLDQSDGGKKWARLKQAAFVIAANVVTPAQLGQRVSVDLQKAVGQQVVIKLEQQEGKEYLDLSYADIWHVDDPHCEKVPKNTAAIAMIPAAMRHEKAWFDQLKPKKTAGANGSGSAGQQQKQSAAAASNANYDDL